MTIFQLERKLKRFDIELVRLRGNIQFPGGTATIRPLYFVRGDEVVGLPHESKNTRLTHAEVTAILRRFGLENENIEAV